MALSGARTLMVKGQNFQWKFDHGTTRIRGDAPYAGTVTVQAVGLHGKLQAKIVTRANPAVDHGGHKASVTPQDVRLIIETALGTGWDPKVKGITDLVGPLKLGQYEVPDVEGPTPPVQAAFPSFYYAHPIRHYGTLQADMDRKRIRELFPDCVLHCPEAMVDRFQAHTRTGKPLIDLYREVLAECVGNGGTVIVAPYHQKVIGRGVYEECLVALRELHIPVVALMDGEMHRVRDVQITNPNNWVQYGEVILEDSCT